MVRKKVTSSDVREKVTGEMKYSGNIQSPHMLYNVIKGIKNGKFSPWMKCRQTSWNKDFEFRKGNRIWGLLIN
jgi:hypothetical protein